MLKLSISGKAATGACTNQLTINGPTARDPPVLCGTITGQHSKLVHYISKAIDNSSNLNFCKKTALNLLKLCKILPQSKEYNFSDFQSIPARNSLTVKKSGKICNFEFLPGTTAMSKPTLWGFGA